MKCYFTRSRSYLSKILYKLFIKSLKKVKKDIVQAKLDYKSKNSNFFKEGYKIF